MTKNTVRAFASALVLAVPGLAFAKVPVSSGTPSKTSAPLHAAVRASAPAPSKGENTERKPGASAHKKHSGKNDSAKNGKGDNGTNSHKH